MKNIIIGLFLSLFLSACGPGKDSKDDDKGDGKADGTAQGEQAAGEAGGGGANQVQPPSSSKEIMKASEIAGVYTGKADVDYSFYIPFGSLFIEQKKQNVKVMINHSGSDENKILIARVEKADSPGEAFCTVWTGFGLSEGEEEIENGEESQKVSFISFESDKKESFGSLEDVNYVESLRILDQTSSKLKIDIHSKDSTVLSAEPIDNLMKTSEQLIEFSVLLQTCFSSKGSGDEPAQEGSVSNDAARQRHSGIVFSI